VVGREHFAPAVRGRERGVAVTRSEVEHLVSRADIDGLARLFADDRQSDADASVIARRPDAVLPGVERLEAQQALPASRKIFSLFGCLALAPRAVARSRLRDLMREAPGAPRGELRWCPSKSGSDFDDGDRRRVLARDDTVALDLTDCHVDAIEIAHAIDPRVDGLALER
jgi:hypothetical protein